ncbi:MAG TPA: agmatine deiminase family protein, partial [Acidobacteriota bacterium]|nr:agmatine deiminase family protein [Acidobacteriota bacterium]
KENDVSSALLDRVIFHHIPTDSSWTRDFGPIFVRDADGNQVITDWIFNSWGGKYPPWNHDDVVPQHVSKIFRLPFVQPGIVLEGGSIDINGKGTLLTTEQCLLNQNRNPHLNRQQIERYLNEFLGATNVLWLKEGIIGDDTDGHIDDIARFVDANTVVCALEENESDENYEILKRNFADLKKMRDQDGNPLNVIAIPMPDPVIYEGTRLPASYANFYITNRVVMVPIFRCGHDESAIKILRELFPTREVIGIDCVDLVWGLGTLHCSTQQQPG